MRLDFEHFDGRRQDNRKITDLDTGKVVGFIHSRGVGFGNHGGISVSLFNEKYRGHFNSSDEIYGFVKGVEAVLNHLTDIPERQAPASEVA